MTRATLRSVAALAGVSRQTVSNVLNNNPGMSESTRMAVLAAMEALDYQPSHAARALSRARANTMAYVVYEPTAASFADPYVGHIVTGVYHTLRACGFDLMTHSIGTGRPEDLSTLRGLFQQQRIDGILLVAGQVPDDIVAELDRWPYPVVIFDREWPGGNLTSVTAAHQDGLRQAIEHHAARGRQRVAFVGGPSPSRSSVAEARYQGYLQGLANAGLPFRPEYVVQGDWSHSSGRQALSKLLALPDPPDAVAAASDAMAAGVLQEARARGLTVPQELGVTGYDDFEVAYWLDPQLTTVHLPVEEMAVQATRLLLELVTGERPVAQQFIVPVQLVVRGSS